MQIYFVQNEWQGIKVYEVQNEWQADVVVGMTDNPDMGTAVYRVANEWQAELKIYINSSPFAGYSGSGGFGGRPSNISEFEKRGGWDAVIIIGGAMLFFVFVVLLGLTEIYC